MPEKIPDGAHRCALPFKFNREGLPETMGMDALLDPCLRRESGQQVPYVRLLDYAPAEGAEHRSASIDASLAPNVEPALEERRSTGIEADHAALATFAPLDD